MTSYARRTSRGLGMSCARLRDKFEYTELETREPSEGGEEDEERNTGKKLRYPWQIFFIISTEACERFSFYGMNAILTIYLIELFKKTMSDQAAEDLSTEMFHLFKALAYISPLFGAALADSVFGKFRTILYLSILYAIGQIILAFGAVPDNPEGIVNMPNLPISAIGIILIAFGTGGIKPCVVSLGADQFKVPEQKPQMATYFAMFYASINFGSLISTIATPYLRKVPCLGEDSCFTLAFGVPAALMLFALVLFVLGKSLYTINFPERNVIVESSKCIWYALTHRSMKPKDGHWLEAATGVFDKTFISDLKAVMRVSKIFLFYPMYWALYDQQGSRWTIQATRMNGDTFGMQILPDQMQVANPVLILLLIPFFDRVVYPVLGKLNILKTPLQRIVTGCFILALSFGISGILEVQLVSSYPDLPHSNQGRLTIHNAGSGTINWDLPAYFDGELPGGETVSKNLEAGELYLAGTIDNQKFNLSVTLEGEKTSSYVFHEDDLSLHALVNQDQLDKADSGLPFLRVYVEPPVDCSNPTLKIEAKNWETTIEINAPRFDSEAYELEKFGKHTFKLLCEGVERRTEVSNYEMGGSYMVYLYGEDTMKEYVLTPTNSVHIFWLLPQYIVLTVGEILFSITSLEFAYSQAPPSMKSIMQSLFYLTTAVGNLITLAVVAIVAAIGVEQYIEFFLFAGLMFLFSCLLIWVTVKYKYVYYIDGDDDTIHTDDENDRKQ